MHIVREVSSLNFLDASIERIPVTLHGLILVSQPSHPHIHNQRVHEDCTRLKVSTGSLPYIIAHHFEENNHEIHSKGFHSFLIRQENFFEHLCQFVLKKPRKT